VPRPAPPPPVRLRDARPRDAIGYGVVLALLGFLFAWNVKAFLDRRRLERLMEARRRGRGLPPPPSRTQASQRRV
jgi:hypothetical protein